MSTNTKLAEALRMAIDRIIDLLKGDDGQAFKEAERVLPHFESVLDEYVKSLARQQSEPAELEKAHDAEQAAQPDRDELTELMDHAFNDGREGLAEPSASTREAEQRFRAAAQAVPAVGSPEASALIDSELAAYGWPANPKNAARVGYGACRKLMQAAPAPEAAQAVPADAERLRLAGLTLIGLAEHDPHCTVFDLDDDGKHCACSCGYQEAIAVITQAGKTAPAAPAPEAAQAVPAGMVRCPRCWEMVTVPAAPAPEARAEQVATPVADPLREMLKGLGFDGQCPESIGITLDRWRDGYAKWIGAVTPAPEALPLFVQPVSGDKLWLWQDGHKLLAYRHEYPCYSPGGDPCVLGEPVAEAEYRESYDRSSAP